MRNPIREWVHWLNTEAPHRPLHVVVATMFEKLTALALVALSLWSALCLEEHVPPMRVYGGTSYSFQAWRREPVRTRFGVFHSLEPVYLRFEGKGPRYLFPHARWMGLAAGRMSLGIQLLVANLVARMPFKAVREVADAVGL